MQQHHSRFFVIGLFCLSLCASGLMGCSVFRATGQTVEAVGEGAGHAVSGTGQAIEDAAGETKRDLTGR
jgi:hypothetical protein